MPGYDQPGYTGIFGVPAVHKALSAHLCILSEVANKWPTCQMDLKSMCVPDLAHRGFF